MSLSIEDVRKVAHLARLELSADDEQKFARQIGGILGYIERIQKLDLTGVEPMTHAVPLQFPERADVPGRVLTRDEVLGNAPHAVEGGVAVPRIIE